MSKFKVILSSKSGGGGYLYRPSPPPKKVGGYIPPPIPPGFTPVLSCVSHRIAVLQRVPQACQVRCKIQSFHDKK